MIFASHSQLIDWEATRWPLGTMWWEALTQKDKTEKYSFGIKRSAFVKWWKKSFSLFIAKTQKDLSFILHRDNFPPVATHPNSLQPILSSSTTVLPSPPRHPHHRRPIFLLHLCPPFYLPICSVAEPLALSSSNTS